MKIRIASDLHLEFYKTDDFLLEKSEDEENTILVLAGDICIATHVVRYDYFFKDISNRFLKILYIAGNHEFYGGSIKMTPIKLKDAIKKYKNIKYLDNSKVEIDNVVFIGSTLWTDFNDNDPLCMFDAKHGMNDFRKIRIGPDSEPWRRKFSPQEAYVIHKTSVKYIFDILKNKNKNKKYVIITHMAPSELSISEEFKSDSLNGAYASDLSEEILDTSPDLMIHGHTHRSFDYMLGDTRIVCNPFGYNNIEKNPNFKQQFIIDL